MDTILNLCTEGYTVEALAIGKVGTPGVADPQTFSEILHPLM